MPDNRNLILETVLQAKTHPTADDIYHKLRSEGRRITLATVYNNLNSLCEEGLIRRLSFREKSDRFDNMIRHDHLVCKRCGRVSDICMEDFTGIFENSLGVQLDSYDLKLFHVCTVCQDAETACG